MKRWICYFTLLWGWWVTLQGTSQLGSKPVRTIHAPQCYPWERIECWEDKSPYFHREKFLSTTAHLKKSLFGRGIYEAFQTTTPHSRFFLLHYAKGWQKTKYPYPVLLVHGASSDATRSYAGYYFDGSPGLMFRLRRAGFAVFAITFPNPQGNLFFQREHIANALKIIRKRTKAKKVYIICHSAGGIATRMYLVNMKKRWGTPYQKDVAKVIFVGTPHKGIDFIFRHPIAFIRFHAYGMPCPWDWYAPMGDMRKRNLFCGAYTMQLQLLYDLTNEYPLRAGEPDWRTTYYGGRGHLSVSRGIKEAIRLGDFHMMRLRRKRFPRDLKVYLVAGTKQRLKYHNLQGKVEEEVGEYHGRSDGIVFLKSALDLPGLRKVGAQIADYKVLPMNHVELLYLEESCRWMVQKLEEGE